MLALAPPSESVMVPEPSVSDNDSASGGRHFVKSSVGPEPFPGIPQLPPRQPPEPGQVLLRYDVEQGRCTELTSAGWCCFWSLVCTAPICCCLPCCLPCCQARYQRPVYGYPIQCQIIAGGLGGDEKAAAQAAEQAVAAASGTGEAAATSSGLPPLQITVPPVNRMVTGNFNSPQGSPRPQSIFVPPSAVPPTGFSMASPGYPRYKPETAAGSGGGSAPGSATGTPRSAFAGAGQAPSPPPPPLSYLAVHHQARHGSPLPADNLASQQGHGQSPRHPPPLSDERGLAPQWEMEEEELQGSPSGRTGGAGPRPLRATGTPPAVRPENPMQWRMAARSSSGGGGTWGSRQNSRHVSQDGVSIAAPGSAPAASSVAAAIAEAAVGP